MPILHPIIATYITTNGGTLTAPLEFADGSASAPSVTNTGDTDNGLYFPATNEVGISTAGTGALHIDSSQRVLIGHTASISTGSVNPALQVHGNTTSMISNVRWVASANGGQLLLGHSRGASVGTAGAVVGTSDPLGQIDFVGDDGTDLNTYGARIRALTNGTIAANRIPTDIAFFTAAGSADNDIAEKMRINKSGNLLLGGTASPASATASLAIFNGTAPTGSVTNGVVLYAEDVTASSELKVRDEAGNITTLSPHNFSLTGGPSEDLAWAYYSEKDGKRINVDMLKALRVLESLSGEKLVHIA